LNRMNTRVSCMRKKAFPPSSYYELCIWKQNSIRYIYSLRCRHVDVVAVDFLTWQILFFMQKMLLPCGLPPEREED
jgi:hypothetical protein